MRVRDHLLISTAAAAAARPIMGDAVIRWWAASILIDVDHYAWYVLHAGRTNPLDAIRYFNGPSVPDQSPTRFLHHPVSLGVGLALALRRRSLLPVWCGMVAHVLLDRRHRMAMSRARAAALQRSGTRCEGCGSSGVEVTVHLDTQPALLPSYAPRNHRVLCAACHDLVHPEPRSGGAERTA